MRAVLIAALCSVCAIAAAAPVVLVPLDGAIGPASAHFVKRSIERGAKEGAIQMPPPALTGSNSLTTRARPCASKAA